VLSIAETNAKTKILYGTCDAAFIHLKSSSHAGVLIWPEAFGMRPATRDIAKRFAAELYPVLVPNRFYRISKALPPRSERTNFRWDA
jgi:carboxymethylenebutenolidase